MTAATNATEPAIGNKTNTLKWDFLDIVFLSNAIAAALGRNKTYAPTRTQQERDKNGETLRRDLSSAMVELAAKYKVPVSEAEHRANLSALGKRVTEKCGSFLEGEHLRRGAAQKAFNLYLKFLWCACRIPTPPHCTIDSTVIGKLPSECQNCAWTQIDSEEEYLKIIEAARQVAGSEPLAEWELREAMDVMRRGIR